MIWATSSAVIEVQAIEQFYEARGSR